MPKTFGDQSFMPEIHDNQRHGLQAPSGSAPKALTAGASVGKRHGKACMTHSMQSGTSRISKVDSEGNKVR